MIYGQPITFGGSGNEVIVTAPTGSTVIATKDGKTRTAAENNGVWTFKGLDAGTWTISATLGEMTTTKVVTFVDQQTTTLAYYAKNFADNDWSDIIEACQIGNVPDTWVVGNSKPMVIGDTTYNIDIIGKNHDTYTDGGTAPLTFQLHELYATTYPMNASDTNSGGYDSTNMHNTYLATIHSQMPSEVREAIKAVNKKTSAGSQSTAIETVVCGLFLLSEIEIFGSTTHSVSGEGSQYAYYSAGNSKIKKQAGIALDWWERSPHKSTSTTFCWANTSGNPYFSNYGAKTQAGVSFAFCF